MGPKDLLNGFFAPRSVLIVGVSQSPENLARNIVANLIEFRFPGPFYLLGRRGGYLYGHPIRTSFDEVPEGIDLAVILTPAATVPKVLESCGQKGIRFAVIQSGGFRELGKEGEGLEAEITAIASKYGMRFIGPNCLGILSPLTGLAAVFMPVKDYWRHGGVSIAAQSGGVGVTYLYGLARENIGLSRFASIGNKLNVDECDLLKMFEADDETRIIVFYLEDFVRGREFFEALRRCKKPVLIHKANRTSLSKGIAFSHTAALATDDRVVDAAIKQANAIRVRSMHEMMSRIKALMLPRPKGNRLAVIARSGGHAVIAADAAEDAGFELPPYPDEFLASVPGSFEHEVIRRGNPLDLGDLYDFEAYARILEAVVTLQDFDAVLMVHEYFAQIEGEESRRLIPAAAELSKRFDKPIVLVLVTDEREQAQIKRLYDYPFFTSIEEALMALGEVARMGAKKGSEWGPPSFDEALKKAAEMVKANKGHFGPSCAFEVLRQAGIPVADYVLLKDETEVPESIEFPVAVKVLSARAPHKSEVGGVVLGISGRGDLIATVRDMRRRFGPFSAYEGVMVQKMARQGSEWIIGGKQDPSFGPVVMAGAGGIFVEVLKDTALRLAPIDEDEAKEMLLSLRAAPLLSGVRGQRPVDLSALSRLLSLVSGLLALCPEITELDLNPCIASPEGVEVVDVRMKVEGGR